MKHVAILTLEQALASSIAIPLEMISAADTIHRLRRVSRDHELQLAVVAAAEGAVRMTGGFTVVPNATLADIPRSDLIFVPALWGNPRAAVVRHPTLVSWIREQHQHGATLCSIGTGSYFLAEAGLLDDRVATTHWRYFDEFEQRYPKVRLQRKRFITHEDRLYCTGSVNAVRDVMLHFVEMLFSARIADEVARHFTHELKRSHESMMLAVEQHHTHHDELIIKIQEWLQRNYQRDISMKQLAERFDLNTRTFNRRFRQAADTTPLEYLQEIRVTQAKDLLKHSNLSIAEIAFAVGYQDVSYFTGLFHRLHGATPNAYRRLVRTKLFNVGKGPHAP